MEATRPSQHENFALRGDEKRPRAGHQRSQNLPRLQFHGTTNFKAGEHKTNFCHMEEGRITSLVVQSAKER